MGSSSDGHREGDGTPTPVLLPGKSHGWRSLVGYSPWGCEESDTTERLHLHFLLPCIGEGNGNPLQYSCLENPRDGGAWWAAIYGVTQNRTRLKRLSSSSSSDGQLRSNNIPQLITAVLSLGFPGGSDSKDSACNVGDTGSIPGLGRSPGGGHGNPLQYSCLENPRGKRSLVGYSPGGCKELDTTEANKHTRFG